jgi:hypothetical protein
MFAAAREVRLGAEERAELEAPGRDTYAWETTVREQRESNVHVKEGVTEDEFVAMREARDAKLSAPRLLLPSIQVNIRAGNFPPAEAWTRVLGYEPPSWVLLSWDNQVVYSLNRAAAQFLSNGSFW